MKNFKNVYSILIWITMLIYIICRRNMYFSDDITSLDKMILILFGVFILAPIFNEIDFMGVKLKGEIEKNKLETDRELLQIRKEINNNLINNYNVTNNYINSPDNVLKNMEKDYRTTQKVYKNIEISENDILCLQIRQKIEILLKQLAQKYELNQVNTGVMYLLKLLTNKKIIPSKLYNILVEIIIICNKAIHGEEISQNHSEFIKNTYIQVLGELEELI